LRKLLKEGLKVLLVDGVMAYWACLYFYGGPFPSVGLAIFATAILIFWGMAALGGTCFFISDLLKSKGLIRSKQNAEARYW